MGHETTRSNGLDPNSDRGRLADSPEIERTVGHRVRRALLGAPRKLDDRGLFHKISLAALLAWVGLGADGLSSSAYGPEEAFRTLGEHPSLAVILAVLMATTVFVISAGYSRIIEQFPHGGGGYVVASKLLGEKAGLVSGCALLVDYVLTITISIAAAGDALFSFMPASAAVWKLPLEVLFIILLTLLNLRGVRESVMILTPIFFVFVATHVLLIGGGLLARVPEFDDTVTHVTNDFSSAASELGIGGMMLLILHAFSLGGGTYTGIEAVSNGVPIMRHPQVRTAKRTMMLMACSLAFTATGLLLCYLLWHIEHVPGKTMNAVLVERVAGGLPGGAVFVIVTLIAEGALLVVAAQAGFADGPRVLANMALDSWMPRRFASLSERLTTQNGIVLMGLAALAALIYTQGSVRYLVVMYSINVFLTFSLSLGGMLLHSVQVRRRLRSGWLRRSALFLSGLALCLTILTVTIFEKFMHGGWITLAITGSLIVLCVLIRIHYRSVSASLKSAFAALERATSLGSAPVAPPPQLAPGQPTAAILVTSFDGVGIHTTLNALRAFPNHFKNIVFLSVGVIDSGGFKGEDSLDQLRAQTQQTLDRYVAFTQSMGLPAASRMAIGTDPVEEAERLCLALLSEFPQTTFIAGRVIFQRDTWYRRMLHNQTVFAIQQRLQWAGRNMLILPARIQEGHLKDPLSPRAGS